MKRRTDGRWEHSIALGRQDDGKFKYHHVCAKTKAELVDKVNAIEEKLRGGVDISLDNPKLSEWALRWLEAEKSDKATKTYEMYHTFIVNHINPTLGNMYLDKVRAIDVKNLLNEKNKTLSKSTLHKLLITIKQIFRTAFINNYISRNNVEYVSAPANKKVNHRLPLESDQVEALRKVALTHPYGKLPMVMLYCGLRRGEALALMKTDIGSDTISVNKSFEYSKNQPIVKTPKTKAGTREVPIPTPLRAYLGQKTSSGIYLFERESKPISYTAYGNIWNSIVKEYRLEMAGGNVAKMKFIPPITAHQLRHTYATMLYDAGVDPKSAQGWCGHANLEVTLGIYTHLSKNKEQQSIQKFNDYFGGESPEASRSEI